MTNDRTAAAFDGLPYRPAHAERVQPDARLGRARAASILAMACNLAIVVSTVVCVASFFERGGEGNMSGGVGLGAFVYFTVDSNVLMTIAALLAIPFNLRRAVSGQPMPRGLLVFKFVSAVAVGVTFWTVVLLLGRIYGYPPLFVGNNLFMHLTTPAIAFVAAGFLEAYGEKPVPLWACALGMLPVALYAAVYATMVVFIGSDKGGWPDFYGFNVGGMWPVSAAVMLLATLVLSLLLRAIQTAVSRIP